MLIEALHDASPILRWDIIFALGEIGDARAISVLEDIAATDERLTPDNTTLAEEAQAAIRKIMKKQQNAS